MSKRFRVATDVLEWIFGRPPTDGSQEPFPVQEVSPDGAIVWLGLEQRPGPGGTVTRYVSHNVPEENRDRALALRFMLEDGPPDLPDDMKLIGFALSGDHELSYQSAPRFFAPKPVSPAVVVKRFKSRPKKHR
jgi:hypothetical protein